MLDYIDTAQFRLCDELVKQDVCVENIRVELVEVAEDSTSEIDLDWLVLIDEERCVGVSESLQRAVAVVDLYGFYRPVALASSTLAVVLK